MSEISEYAGQVLRQFSKSITDQVFLLIQHDRHLMHEYLRLVESHGLDPVNQQLGKAVKRHFALEDDAQRQDSPQSTLIQSHQQFL